MYIYTESAIIILSSFTVSRILYYLDTGSPSSLSYSYPLLSTIMYTKPIHLASLLLPLLFNPSLALNIGEKAFDIRSALVGFNYYEVTVSRANETDANENSYPTTRCENNPDASSPLQIEMECSIQCPCPSCSDECPELEGDLANPIKVVLQQPPRTGDGRPDFNTSGVNFIMEAEG